MCVCVCMLKHRKKKNKKIMYQKRMVLHLELLLLPYQSAQRIISIHFEKEKRGKKIVRVSQSFRTDAL